MSGTSTPYWCSMNSLTKAVRRALREAPASVRALAKEAGIPHSTLVRIKQGQLGASVAVASALLQVLECRRAGFVLAESVLRESLFEEVSEDE